MSCNTVSHPTFQNRIRLICEAGDLNIPSVVSERMGSFPWGIRVFMKDGSHVDLEHTLKF